MRYILFLIIFFVKTSCLYSQYQEVYMTRTTSTNSVFPRQFPSMTIRKMSDKEYWLFESLGTNTIFHRQFPTYIIRRQNFSTDQAWGVYRTTSTNSVFPDQFPDRYIAAFPNTNTLTRENIFERIKHAPFNRSETLNTINEFNHSNNSYTYSRSLRQDGKPSYNPERPE